MASNLFVTICHKVCGSLLMARVLSQVLPGWTNRHKPGLEPAPASVKQPVASAGTSAA